MDTVRRGRYLRRLVFAPNLPPEFMDGFSNNARVPHTLEYQLFH